MSAKPILLLVHDDPDVLDGFTALFEGNGYEVLIGPTAFAARAKLERAEVVAIVAGWDAGGGAGESLAGWAAEQRPDLLDRFAVLADASKLGAAGARLAVFSPTDYDKILEFVDRVVRDLGVAPASQMEDESPISQRSPRLLLIEDDDHQVRFIAEILAGYGFDVRVAADPREGIEVIKSGAVDVVLSDWYMGSGGGEGLYDWLIENNPELLERTVFITAGSTREIRERAPLAVCFPKGQDAKLLMAALTRAARRAFDG